MFICAQVCRAMAADLKPKDKLALKNTCKILHELFQDEQETWLFPEVKNMYKLNMKVHTFIIYAFVYHRQMNLLFFV